MVNKFEWFLGICVPRHEPTILNEHRWWWTRAYDWANSMTMAEFNEGGKMEPIEDEE